MSALTTLLGEFKGVFGKTFLIAGVLPAAVLLFGWILYADGLVAWKQTLIDFVPVEEDRRKAEVGGGKAPDPRRDAQKGQMPDAPTSAKNLPNSDRHDNNSRMLSGGGSLRDAAGTFVLQITILLGVGLVFFASRPLVVQFYQGLPGRLLAPIRNCLQRFKDRSRQEALQALDIAEWRMTVVKWPTKGFFEPETVPRQLEELVREKPYARSKRAREIMEQSLSTARQRLGLAPAQMDRIIEGLGALYVAEKNEPENEKGKEERNHWEAIFGDNYTHDPHERDNYWRQIEVYVGREVRLASRKYARYPRPTWMMPTDFGNVMSVLDDYAQDRYGIDTSTLWLRLWGVLSKDERQNVSDGRLGMEVMLNLSVSLLALAALIVVSELRDMYGRSPPTAWSGVCLVGALILAFIAYRGAVFAAAVYSDRVIRCVDLNRRKLIKAMGFTLPKTVASERDLFEQLGRFLGDGAALNPSLELTQTSTASEESVRSKKSAES